MDVPLAPIVDGVNAVNMHTIKINDNQNKKMDILNLKIGSSTRKLLVKDIKKDKVEVHSRLTEKITFVTVDEFTMNEFNISDVWVVINGVFQIKGLWLALQNDGDEISKSSSLAKLLTHYSKSTLGDFVDDYVYVKPDDNNFLVILACNMPIN